MKNIIKSNKSLSMCNERVFTINLLTLTIAVVVAKIEEAFNYINLFYYQMRILFFNKALFLTEQLSDFNFV